MLRLAEVRKAAGYRSAEAFARTIGMPANTYRNYENGARKLNLELACVLCEHLGCSVDELVTGPQEPHVQEYTSDELELIRLFRMLTDKGRHAVLVGLRDFAYTREEE